MDNKVSFGSTYRIPLIQQGINKSNRAALKKVASRYQNALFPNGESGCVRISVRKRLDNRVEQEIKRLGFKIFQKFEKHNVPKTIFENSNVSKMDLYIGKELKNRNYQQFGKNKARMQNKQKFDVNQKSELELMFENHQPADN